MYHVSLISKKIEYIGYQDNKFGMIATVGTDKDAPNIPILNIYLVKKNELVFTVQKIKNRKRRNVELSA